MTDQSIVTPRSTTRSPFTSGLGVCSIIALLAFISFGLDYASADAPSDSLTEVWRFVLYCDEPIAIAKLNDYFSGVEDVLKQRLESLGNNSVKIEEAPESRELFARLICQMPELLGAEKPTHELWQRPYRVEFDVLAPPFDELSLNGEAYRLKDGEFEIRPTDQGGPQLNGNRVYASWRVTFPKAPASILNEANSQVVIKTATGEPLRRDVSIQKQIVPEVNGLVRVYRATIAYQSKTDKTRMVELMSSLSGPGYRFEGAKAPVLFLPASFFVPEGVGSSSLNFPTRELGRYFFISTTDADAAKGYITPAHYKPPSGPEVTSSWYPCDRLRDVNAYLRGFDVEVREAKRKALKDAGMTYFWECKRDKGEAEHKFNALVLGKLANRFEATLFVWDSTRGIYEPLEVTAELTQKWMEDEWEKAVQSGSSDS